MKTHLPMHKAGKTKLQGGTAIAAGSGTEIGGREETTPHGR
jgi:hypothetical protein